MDINNVTKHDIELQLQLRNKKYSCVEFNDVCYIYERFQDHRWCAGLDQEIYDDPVARILARGPNWRDTYEALMAKEEMKRVAEIEVEESRERELIRKALEVENAPPPKPKPTFWKWWSV